MEAALEDGRWACSWFGNAKRGKAGGGERLVSGTAPTSAYAAAYSSWQADPEAWWAKAAEGIDWSQRWARVFDPALGVSGQ